MRAWLGWAAPAGGVGLARGLAGVLMGLCAVVAGASAEQRPIRLGPLELGMRIGEIKAALPSANWQLISKSAFTGGEFRVVAEDALDLAGRRLKVEVTNHPYNWDIGLTARFNEATPQACEQSGLQLLAALEVGTGPLSPGRDPGETVTFGQASSARFTAFEGRREAVQRKHVARSEVNLLVLSAQIQAQRQEVKASAVFDAKSTPNCRFNVMALGWQPQPPMQAVPYEESKTLQRMNIGDRHRLASGVELPEAVVVVPMQCQVSRQSGKVLKCNELGNRPFSAAVSNVAGRYAGAMAFEMSGIDRDEPQPVLIDIPVRVSRDDVKPLDFGQAPVLPMTDLVFTATPSAKEVQQAYPFKALRQGVGARVETRCQVQTDGSLICLAGAVLQSNAQTDLVNDFSNAAARLLPLYRVAPALKDGRPSAGQVLGLGVQFLLAE